MQGCWQVTLGLWLKRFSICNLRALDCALIVMYLNFIRTSVSDRRFDLNTELLKKCIIEVEMLEVVLMVRRMRWFLHLFSTLLRTVQLWRSLADNRQQTEEYMKKQHGGGAVKDKHA